MPAEKQPSRRRGQQPPPPSKPNAPPAETGSEPSPGSSAPSSPLGLIGVPFRRPERGDSAPPAQTVRDLDAPEYEPPAPAPLEWDEDRAALILRGAGFMLHTMDPLAGSPFAPELWKLTEEDLDAMAAPAARIANRYAPARQLAGLSDEVGLGMAAYPYIRRNLVERGRAAAMLKQAARSGPHAPPPGYVEPAATPPPPPPPAPLHVIESEPPHLAEPVLVHAGEGGPTEGSYLGEPRSVGEALDVAEAGARGDVAGDVFDREPPAAGAATLHGVVPDHLDPDEA